MSGNDSRFARVVGRFFDDLDAWLETFEAENRCRLRAGEQLLDTDVELRKHLESCERERAERVRAALDQHVAAGTAGSSGGGA